MIWPCNYCYAEFVEESARDAHHDTHDPETDERWE